MSEEQELREYTCLEAIRVLSGIFNPEQAPNILAIINLIVRGMMGIAETDYVKDTVLRRTEITLTDLCPENLTQSDSCPESEQVLDTRGEDE